MSTPRQSAWVERIFAELTVIYGHAFLGRWSGLDLGAVKASWAKELAGLADHPSAIRQALDNLPSSDPPTVLAFRDLCRAAIRDERKPYVAELPAPKEDPEVIAKRVAGLREFLARNRAAMGHMQ